MIPSIASLTAFESVARLQSFSHAAEELCVTQSAVSHRVRVLEESLGVKLFRRNTRSLVLTLAGQRYLPVVQTSLQGLQQGTRAVRRPRGRARTLHLLVTRVIGSLWLIPRLDHLNAEIPGLDVSVVTHNGWLTEADLEHYEFDAAILLANDGAHLGGLPRKKLVSDYGLPVCNPILMKGNEGLRRPSDLRYHTLLHARSCPEVWPKWLASAELEGLAPKSELQLDHTGLTVQAALNGLGVAIAHGPLVANHISSGILAAPFGQRQVPVHVASSYFCVWRHELSDCPEVIALRAWIQREMADVPVSEFGKAGAYLL